VTDNLHNIEDIKGHIEVAKIDRQKWLDAYDEYKKSGDEAMSRACIDMGIAARKRLDNAQAELEALK